MTDTSRRLNVIVGQINPNFVAGDVSTEPAVLFELSEEGIATITLNRPSNRNSMTADLLEDFGKCIERIKNDRKVRCVVITGKGDSFCAGADFKAGAAFEDDVGYQSPWEKLRYNAYGNFLTVCDLRVPVIGALNGHAIGGGLGLALVCDIRVANETARYGSNFVRLGLHPGMATTYILPRLVGLPKANELIFTGRVITGAEAAQIGLANYAVPKEEVLKKAMEIAREIASAAPLAVKWSKDSLMQNVPFNPKPAALLEAHMQSRSFETEDTKEGVKALLQKRVPKFSGR